MLLALCCCSGLKPLKLQHKQQSPSLDSSIAWARRDAKQTDEVPGARIEDLEVGYCERHKLLLQLGKPRPVLVHLQDLPREPEALGRQDVDAGRHLRLVARRPLWRAVWDGRVILG
jgi:hypothetical protein|eukprot:COSAG06_NODE_208_length_20182_cov_31.214759_14_plen_116_part_00